MTLNVLKRKLHFLKNACDNKFIMKDIIKDFEYLSLIIEKIDDLVFQASKTRGKKEKKILLTEAQALADAYQEYCEEGGNHVKQFNALL